MPPRRLPLVGRLAGALSVAALAACSADGPVAPVVEPNFSEESGQTPPPAEVMLCKQGETGTSATFTIARNPEVGTLPLGSPVTILASPENNVTPNCRIVWRTGGASDPVTEITITEIDMTPGTVVSGIFVLGSLDPTTGEPFTGNTVSFHVSPTVGALVIFKNEGAPVPPSGRIGDFVWSDANGNGIQEAGEPGIPGVTVTLTQGGSTIATTTTDAAGNYLFSGLSAGCYEVVVATPSGTTPSPTGAGTPESDSNGSPAAVCLPTDSTEDLTIDFGFVPPAPPGAVLLIIDEDGIDNGLHFNQSGGGITPSGPQFFGKNDVNDDKPGHRQRDVLRYFANNVGRTITVRTGQTGDEGWFAPNCIPQKWLSGSSNTCLTGSDRATALDNYFGLNGSSAVPAQSRLDKIPAVMPLRARGLVSLIGKDVCAVVYDSDVSINYNGSSAPFTDGNLQGETLGIVAFHVNQVRTLNNFSSSTLPEVQITILDTSVCGNFQLFNAPVPSSSSEPNDRVVENLAGQGSKLYRLLQYQPGPLFY